MSSVIEYNGFQAKVEYDDDDGIFVGTVIGINDMLGFHGSSVNELKESFHNCIDNYLQWCKEEGKEPEKEYKGIFDVKISPDAHRKAALDAEIDGITLNEFVAEAIDEKIARKRAIVS